MTKAEKAYIEKRSEQFWNWGREERNEAAKAQTAEEREEHLLQARLNECASNTLDNLLVEFFEERHLTHKRK